MPTLFDPVVSPMPTLFDPVVMGPHRLSQHVVMARNPSMPVVGSSSHSSGTSGVSRTRFCNPVLVSIASPLK